jgi:hypothetical protein
MGKIIVFIKLTNGQSIEIASGWDSVVVGYERLTVGHGMAKFSTPLDEIKEVIIKPL